MLGFLSIGPAYLAASQLLGWLAGFALLSFALVSVVFEYHIARKTFEYNVGLGGKVGVSGGVE